jgi:hypothetical protein
MRLRFMFGLGLVTAACFAEEGGTGSSDADAGSSDDTSGSGTTTASTTTAGTSGTSTGTSTSETSDSATTGSGCGDDTVCTMVPDGWSGPVEVLDGPGDCGDALAFEGGNTLQAPDAECQCNCGATACQVTVEAHDEPNACDDAALSSVETVANTCIDIPMGALLVETHVAAAPPDQSCEAGLDTTLPPPMWAPHISGCATPTVEGCPGGACVGNAPVCVFSPGDVPCPAGPFVARSVIFTGIDDMRTCSECECQLTQAAQCFDGGVVELSNPGDCVDPVLSYAPGCFGTGGTVRMLYRLGYPGLCSPVAPSQPLGDAMAKDPLTVCCTA